MPRPAANQMPLGFMELTAFARAHNLDARRALRILEALDRELYGAVLLKTAGGPNRMGKVYVRADIMDRLGVERVLGLPQLAREVHKQRRKARSRFAKLEARIEVLETTLAELRSNLSHSDPINAVQDHHTHSLRTG